MSGQPIKRWSPISLILVVLYVLSVGPTQWFILWSGSRPSDPVGIFIRVFYAPLIWFAENIEPFAELWKWHVEWWAGH
jgi:hypothetical protein